MAADPSAPVHRLARRVRAEYVPDPRVEVFEVRTRRNGGALQVLAITTLPNAGLDFARRLEADGVELDLRLRILPDPALQPDSEALVRAPLAPVYRRATMNSTLLTQYPMGHRLTLLMPRNRFWRIRGEDGHVGWVHRGYLERGGLEWALAWERGETGDPVFSLGAEVIDEDDAVIGRLPWGARVIQRTASAVVLPDGRTGRVGAGEVVRADRLWDRFPPRVDSVARTARRWLGSPYLWGGVTRAGVDCSGLVQSVYWLHGVALPRDSDMQALVGEAVEPGEGGTDCRVGDLLFFAERERVNHVALSVGGSRVIHASASNGAVAIDDVAGDGRVARLLRSSLVGARRLLPA
jgi:hypothetical protein